VLAAALSDEASRPLFASPVEVKQILALLDEARNPLGHYVLNPAEQIVRRLIGGAAAILGSMVRAEPRIRSLDVVRGMVRQPSEFLNNIHPIRSGSGIAGNMLPLQAHG
jgi:hypothetical protein